MRRLRENFEWRRKNFISSMSSAVVELVGLKNCPTWTSLDALDFSSAAGYMAGCVTETPNRSIKTAGHSHTDSLKRIGEASFLERG